MMNRHAMLSLTTVLAVVSGCASQTDDAPVVADGDVDPQAAIIVNGFTLNANKPTVSGYVGPVGMIYTVTGSVTISGGSGTQKQGVCALSSTRAAEPPAPAPA